MFEGIPNAAAAPFSANPAGLPENLEVVGDGWLCGLAAVVEATSPLLILVFKVFEDREAIRFGRGTQELHSGFDVVRHSSRISSNVEITSR